MKFLSRVVWSEGMHLGPQHFQTQSRYFEDTLWFLHSNSRGNAWGLLHCSLDHEAVRNGRALITFAAGILPDGLIFDIPEPDPVPEPAKLHDLFAPTASELVLFLTIPQRHDLGLDCDLAGGTSTRYGSVQRTLRDDTLGLDEYDVSFARKNLAVASQDHLAPGSVSFPIARVLRDGKGGFLCDPEFIPPCLRIGASERLMLLLQRLAESIDEKIDTVRRGRKPTSPMDLGTSALDVANYWLLHCLSSGLPPLRHHLKNRTSHPEDVYGDLARLAGALSTFTLDSSPDEVPPYVHEDLTSTFRELDRLLRRHLDVVVPPNATSLDFKPTAPYVYTAPANDERYFRRARWILGVRSSIRESALLRLVPRLVKVCSGRGVITLIKRALPGLELTHLPVPPSALDAHADMQYFSISLDGVCWKDINDTRQVGVYIPGEIADAVFELTVITESTA